MDPPYFKVPTLGAAVIIFNTTDNNTLRRNLQFCQQLLTSTTCYLNEGLGRQVVNQFGI